MLIAVATRERAECIGRHVGAVLVREGRIVATGYNGTPRGFPRCNARSRAAIAARTGSTTRAGSAYDVCICVHAEQNAILQAARLGYSLDGAHCYTTLRPCFGCLKELRQAGIERIVYLNAWEPGGELEREAYDALLGSSRGSGRRRAARARPGGLALGLERAGGRRGMRRPPPIAGLFTRAGGRPRA